MTSLAAHGRLDMVWQLFSLTCRVEAAEEKPSDFPAADENLFRTMFAIFYNYRTRTKADELTLDGALVGNETNERRLSFDQLACAISAMEAFHAPAETEAPERSVDRSKKGGGVSAWTAAAVLKALSVTGDPAHCVNYYMQIYQPRFRPTTSIFNFILG